MDHLRATRLTLETAGHWSSSLHSASTRSHNLLRCVHLETIRPSCVGSSHRSPIHPRCRRDRSNRARLLSSCHTYVWYQASFRLSTRTPRLHPLESSLARKSVSTRRRWEAARRCLPSQQSTQRIASLPCGSMRLQEIPYDRIRDLRRRRAWLAS